MISTLTTKTLTTSSNLEVTLKIRRLSIFSKVFVELLVGETSAGYAVFKERANPKSLSVAKISISPEFQRLGIATTVFTNFQADGYTILRAPVEQLTESAIALSAKVRNLGILSETFWE